MSKSIKPVLDLACLPAVEVIAGSQDTPIPQREYVVVPDGQVKSSSGDFLMDQRSADLVIKNFESMKRDLAVDYEHQSLGGEYQSRSGPVGAAGWIKQLRYVAGKGLLALIRWVPQAAELIRSGAYRYLSPVVVVDKKTTRVIQLFNAALATNPAIVGMPPLTLFSRRIFVMAEEPQETTGQSVDTLIVSIRELLSLPEDAAPEDILQAAIEALKAESASESESESDTDAVASSITRALGIKGNADATEVAAAVARLKDTTVPKDSWVQVNARVAVLEQSNAQLQERIMTEEADALVKRYVNDGKLTAAMAQIHRQRLTASAANFEAAKTEFGELMEASPVVIPQGATLPPGSAGSGDRQTIINKASREFDSDPAHGNTTSKRAFVNLMLRESGKERLNDDEAKKYQIVTA